MIMLHMDKFGCILRIRIRSSFIGVRVCIFIAGSVSTMDFFVRPIPRKTAYRSLRTGSWGKNMKIFIREKKSCNGVGSQNRPKPHTIKPTFGLGCVGFMAGVAQKLLDGHSITIRLGRLPGHEKFVPQNLLLWVQHFKGFLATTFPSTRVFSHSLGFEKGNKTNYQMKWHEHSPRTPRFWCHQGES